MAKKKKLPGTWVPGLTKKVVLPFGETTVSAKVLRGREYSIVESLPVPIDCYRNEISREAYDSLVGSDVPEPEPEPAPVENTEEDTDVS